MTYGETIKQGRETRGLTQEQLAEALDVSRQAVSKWEMDRARPARSKLERLSEALDIPMEAWAAIDAEQAADDPPDGARPWKIAAGALAAVCLALGIALAAVLRIPAAEEPPVNGWADIPQELPKVLPLTVTRHDFDFGDIPLGDYDPALVPYLDDPVEVLEHALWDGEFPDGVRLSLAETIADWNLSTEFYHLYLFYALPGEGWRILFRVAEDLPDPWDSRPEAEAFTNVLGRDGFRLTLYSPEGAYWSSCYIAQRPGGVPCLMYTTSGAAREADVDEDGMLEIVDFCAPAWEITDTAGGEEGAFVCRLSEPRDVSGMGAALDFVPERGGFVAKDSDNAILARYVLRDGSMVRVPLTDFSVLDYPDAAGTDVTFVTDGLETLSDGRSPDEVLDNGLVRITHRQQAYLALQELYSLTGLTVDACFCAANEYGVLFSLLPDGFNQRSFYTADFGEDCGGRGVPGLRIVWKELDNCGWSPLSLAEAARPAPGSLPEEAFRWYYGRLRLFRTGEAARMAGENLYLDNGDLYQGTLRDTAWGPALTGLRGPYPGGIVNH